MGLFSRILNKEKKSEAAAAPAGARTKEKREALPSPAKELAPVFHAGILRSPHITEKSVSGAAKRAYTFRVPEGAGKVQVKEAVERAYRVHVERIRMISLPSKARRIGRQVGKRAGITKAIVRLADGERIEFAE